MTGQTPVAPGTGIRAHRRQFWLLVGMNALVGGMLGLERTILPLIAAEEFHLSSAVTIFSFIIAFGAVKACANLTAGWLADRVGRRRVLVAGWIAALPVPVLLGWGASWNAIVAANILLGVSQGLTWSMTVTMKIDLASARERGLAMGLNEFAGYGGAGVTALATGFIAAHAGLRPQPFYLGVIYSLLGLALAIWTVRDTTPAPDAQGASGTTPGLLRRTLLAASQAGLVNNLNDAMSWGVFPLLFAAQGLSLQAIGEIKATYLLTWSVGQLATGALSDRWGRRRLIVGGMLVQAAAHAVVGFGLERPRLTGLAGAWLLGAGTAMAYPALLALVGDVAPPARRARALGAYRFWRDLGYVAGGLTSGIVAQTLGLIWTVHVSGLLTLASAMIAWALTKTSAQPG
jgi:MFS family permease